MTASFMGFPALCLSYWPMTVLHSESLVGQLPVLIREQDPVYFVEYKGIVRSTEEGVHTVKLHIATR